ncbi:MAG: substrate-binding domain-containing protein, partial [Acidimicrobiales bacterium]
MSRTRAWLPGLCCALIAIGAVAIPAATRASASSTTDPAQLVCVGDSWPDYTLRQLDHDAYYANPNATAGLSPTFTAARGEAESRGDLASGATDVAVVSEPLTSSEVATAHQNGITPGYVPFAQGSVAIIAALQLNAQHGSTLLTGIRLTLATLAKLVTHQITKWYDPEVINENPANAQNLPYLDNPSVQSVVRRDSSATTVSLVSAFLADPAAKPIWQTYATQLGIDPNVAPDQWPADPDSNTAGVTSGSKGAITAAMNLDQAGNPILTAGGDHSVAYIAPQWASQFNAPIVAIPDEEATPQFVTPTAAAVTAAFASPGVTFDSTTGLYTIKSDKLTGVGAYPIPQAAYVAV